LWICDGTTTNFDRQNLAWEIQVSIANCIQNDVQSPYDIVIKELMNQAEKQPDYFRS